MDALRMPQILWVEVQFEMLGQVPAVIFGLVQNGI